MSTTKQMISLKVGEKFSFNNGETFPSVWVVDKIAKDNRFPNENEPMEVWKVNYHLEASNILNPLTQVSYADKDDIVLVADYD